MAGNVILILGGTREAYEIACDLEQIKDVTVITSLAGVTRSPRLPTGRVRYGGFGGHIVHLAQTFLPARTIFGDIQQTLKLPIRHPTPI